MDNNELKKTLIKELGIESLPEEAQNEIVSKLGEIILKSLTVAIFEKLPPEARAEFEQISIQKDELLIQSFLEKNIPDLPLLLEEEVKKTLQNFREMSAGDTE